MGILTNIRRRRGTVDKPAPAVEPKEENGSSK